MWHNGVQILATFAHHTSAWAFANVDGVGWRRIKDGAPDGVTNLLLMLSAAHAHGRPVNVYIDGSDLITTAYML